MFNIEGEGIISADFVTYASLTDMLSDTNRTGVSTVGGLFGHNIVGSGAFVDDDVQEVPEPAAFALFVLGLISLSLATRLQTY